MKYFLGHSMWWGGERVKMSQIQWYVYVKVYETIILYIH